MKITSFQLTLVDLPYRRPIQWRSLSEDSGSYLLLRLCTDEGAFGLAEVADKPTWTASTPRATAVALREVYEPLLRGLDPLDENQIRHWLDLVPGWASAKSLLDVALADLRARVAGLPLWRYLGGTTDEVQVSWLVNRGSLAEQMAEAGEAVAAYGFSAFKVKVGTDPRADVELVRQIRREFGDGAWIGVDANTSYSREDAIRVARALADSNVALFEDPCVLEPGPLAAEVFRTFPQPVMVDLAAGSFETARAFLHDGAGAIALKIGRTGYTLSERIRQACEEAGALAGVGIYAESGLGSLVGLHFHAAHDHLHALPAENSFFLKLQEDLLEDPIQVRHGRVQLPSSAGIGVQPSPEVLARLGRVLD